MTKSSKQTSTPEQAPPPNLNLIPELAALSDLVSKCREIDKQMELAADQIARTQKWVDPVGCAAQIERNLDNPEALEDLRLQRGESLLTLNSHQLRFRVLFEQRMKINSQLFDAIKPLVSMSAAMNSRQAPNFWLRPMIEQRCLEAEALRAYRHELGSLFENFGGRSRDEEILGEVLGDAFDKSLKEHLKEQPQIVREWIYDFDNLGGAQHSVEKYYRAEVIAHRKNFDHELRFVYAVEFSNSEYPELSRLPSLLSDLQSQLVRVEQVGKELAKQNGMVNEAQYEDRLVRHLHGKYSYDIKAEKARQESARSTYQKHRIELHTAIAAAEVMRREVVECLRACVNEYDRWAGVLTTPFTIDDYLTDRLARNNCLAADLAIRNAGRDLLRQLCSLAQDKSLGHGKRAVGAEFAELAKYYGSFGDDYRSAGRSADDVVKPAPDSGCAGGGTAVSADASPAGTPTKAAK